MNSKLSTPVYKWLRKSGIKVSRRHLEDQLQSHPDYPSLASITDTLYELGIENISLIVDRERLDDLPVPFLSHSSQGGGNFVVINDIEKQIRSDKEFEQNWDGIVVLAEKPANWYHADNEKALAGEELDRRQLIVAAAVIGLLAVLSLYSQITPTLAALMLVAITGLGITILIVQQELGISNQITEQLCNASKETDCHAVI